MSLAGKHVVVTGAAGTLGRAVAEEAQSRGATVIPVDVVEGVVAGASILGGDLTEAAACAKLFASIVRIDTLFCIAGGFTMGATAYEPAGEWDAMFRINVTTLRNTVQAAVPKMIKAGAGAIVTVGALSALKGQAGMSAYIAAKSAVMRLTESLSMELRDKGINVNGVLPSIIDTLPNRKDMPDADFSRWVTPRDLARVICFLGSDEARAIHGALLPVAGRL